LKPLLWGVFSLNGTVSVILSDPPCKDGNARFSTDLPDQNLSDQVLINLETNYFKIVVSIQTWLKLPFPIGHAIFQFALEITSLVHLRTLFKENDNIWRIQFSSYLYNWVDF